MSYKDLWHKKWGPPFFTETMSRNRFTEIMKYLRFDIQSTRVQRKKTDRFCLASEIWNKFTDNCIASIHEVKALPSMNSCIHVKAGAPLFSICQANLTSMV
nr:unnamed protein product [Callosobruchus chinensis]